MFELAVTVIAIALLPLAFAVAVPLIFFFITGVTVLWLGFAIMHDATLGYGMAVVFVLTLAFAWIFRGRWSVVKQAVGWCNSKWKHRGIAKRS